MNARASGPQPLVFSKTSSLQMFLNRNLYAHFVVADDKPMLRAHIRKIVERMS